MLRNWLRGQRASWRWWCREMSERHCWTFLTWMTASHPPTTQTEMVRQQTYSVAFVGRGRCLFTWTVFVKDGSGRKDYFDHNKRCCCFFKAPLQCLCLISVDDLIIFNSTDISEIHSLTSDHSNRSHGRGSRSRSPDRPEQSDHLRHSPRQISNGR